MNTPEDLDVYELLDTISRLEDDVDRITSSLRETERRLEEEKVQLEDAVGYAHCRCGTCNSCLLRALDDVVLDRDAARSELESLKTKYAALDARFDSYISDTSPLLDELQSWKKLVYSVRFLPRESSNPTF